MSEEQDRVLDARTGKWVRPEDVSAQDMADVQFLNVPAQPGLENVTFLNHTPHIHLHFLTGTDEMVDAQGFAIVELCCHGCGTAIGVKFYLPPGQDTDPNMVALRGMFQKWHTDCSNNPLFKAKCPEQDIYPPSSFINLLEHESSWGLGGGMPGDPKQDPTLQERWKDKVASMLGPSSGSGG